MPLTKEEVRAKYRKLPKPDDFIVFVDDAEGLQDDKCEFSCALERLFELKVSRFFYGFVEDLFDSDMINDLPVELQKPIMNMLYQMAVKSYIVGFHDACHFNIGDYTMPEHNIRVKYGDELVDLEPLP